MKDLVAFLRSIPYPATAVVIASVVGVYLYQLFLGPEVGMFNIEYSTIPRRIEAALHWIRVEGPTLENVEPLLTLFTAVFLHGSETHLGNNLLFLWIFGSLCERTLGKFVFPLWFVLTGAAGNLAQTYLSPGSPAPILGASGGVAGLEATYLILALRWSLPWPHVWPMARPVPPLQLAAVAVFGVVLDILSLGDRASHIAYGAHVGGFMAGAALTLLLTSVRPAPTAPTDRPV